MWLESACCAAAPQAAGSQVLTSTTEVGLARKAELALLALGSVEGNDVVADLDVRNAGADRLDDTTALVAEDDGEGTLGVLAGEGVVVAIKSVWQCERGRRDIRVADTGAERVSINHLVIPPIATH